MKDQKDQKTKKYSIYFSHNGKCVEKFFSSLTDCFRYLKRYHGILSDVNQECSGYNYNRFELELNLTDDYKPFKLIVLYTPLDTYIEDVISSADIVYG